MLSPCCTSKIARTYVKKLGEVVRISIASLSQLEGRQKPDWQEVPRPGSLE